MSSFEWDPCFVTGELEIDAQHRTLVRRINALSDLLIQSDVVPAAVIEEALDGLASYAQVHFRDEEGLAMAAGVDARTRAEHRALHGAFVTEVARMRADVAGGGAAARAVLVFLVQWLAHHILGVDQSLVREIRLIRAGESPAAAHDAEARAAVVTADPLVHALCELFGVLSTRNAELAEANRCLEQRIADRTAALANANEKLERVAHTDVLTGLPNRRSALCTLDALWAAGAPMSVVMVDADHFKWVNDTFGHEAGDEVLRTLAHTLQEALRTDDIVARLGGDEFLLVLPCTALTTATQVAEAVLAQVQGLSVPVGEGRWAGSVSMGVAQRGRHTASVLELLRAADGAVYEAKRLGRGRVSATTNRLAMTA